MTGVGITFLIIKAVLTYFGIEFEESMIYDVIGGFLVAFGWLFTIWGQLRRGDVSWGLFRK